MNKNIGKLDRFARLIIGIVFIVFSLFYISPVLAIFGLFTIYESISGWCIFYQFIGKDTCPIPKDSNKRSAKFKRFYLVGMGILITAIVLNIFAKYLGWLTWYDVIAAFLNIDETPSLMKISLDNWLFLLIVYPLSLSYTAIFITDLEKTTGDKPVDESNSDMSSSLKRKPHPKGGEDVINSKLRD